MSLKSMMFIETAFGALSVVTLTVSALFFLDFSIGLNILPEVGKIL